MQFLNIAAALGVGGFVGYITNYIAIKMLFRPLKPVYIGRFRVPFTPGIVPKRKDALAEILGKAIVDKFFNADDLEIIFKSDAMTDAFAGCIVALLTDTNLRLADIALGSNTADEALFSRLRDELCIRIQAAMLRADLPGILECEAAKIIDNRASNSRFGKVVQEELLSLVAQPLSDKLEKFILTEGRAIILPIIDDELKELSNTPVAEITAAIFTDHAALLEAARQLHQQFMVRFVRPIVESIDVGGMITEKVKQMSAGEVEALVLDVVKSELRYIVLLGAFLGMLIGAINIFI